MIGVTGFVGAATGGREIGVVAANPAAVGFDARVAAGVASFASVNLCAAPYDQRAPSWLKTATAYDPGARRLRSTAERRPVRGVRKLATVADRRAEKQPELGQ
jgi:hypothetical protein